MPTIVYFDIPVDDIERAKNFYAKLFDWKIEKVPGPFEHYFIETTTLSGEAGLSGGMGKRDAPGQGITNFIEVPSVDEYLGKVEKFGCKVLEPKTAVPRGGYYATFVDSENNTIGLWEEDLNAK
jgi:hypothetical protein